MLRAFKAVNPKAWDQPAPFESLELVAPCSRKTGRLEGRLYQPPVFHFLAMVVHLAGRRPGLEIQRHYMRAVLSAEKTLNQPCDLLGSIARGHMALASNRFNARTGQSRGERARGIAQRMLWTAAAHQHQDRTIESGISIDAGIERVHGFQFPNPTGGQSPQSRPRLRDAHRQNCHGRETREAAEANFEREVEIALGYRALVGVEDLASDRAPRRQRRRIDHKARNGLPKRCAKCADRAEGVADETGDRPALGDLRLVQDGCNVFILALK